MERLCYRVLKKMNFQGHLLPQAPEKVLQFGEGGFLRAFVDYFIDLANEQYGFNGKVVMVQPIPQGLADAINTQEGLYTLYLRGMQAGQTVSTKRVISCVSRCIDPYRDFAALLACAANTELRYIVSNTTEAGIAYDPACRFEDAPPASFPGKLTRFLYERFRLGLEGMIILSCELIDHNGRELRRCVDAYTQQWGLGEDFRSWLDEKNLFCSSLVDRIVTGYPAREAEALNTANGYEDSLLDTGEVFASWVIEGPDWLRSELPFCRGNLPVIVTADHTPYKRRKVRILNGAHTTMVLGAYLAGQDIVRHCMQDPVISGYMRRTLYEEIIPTLDLPRQELMDFAAAVMERFANPFIDHQLLAISLNSVSKWRARCLPSLKDYMTQFGTVPDGLALGLAFLIAFYRGERREGASLMARRPAGNVYPITDDAQVLHFFLAHHQDEPEALTHAVMTHTEFWGEDLTALPGLESRVQTHLNRILTQGAYAAMQAVLETGGSR